MDFFDKLSKKASKAYKVTADKTGKIAKETKLKLKMSDLKSKIEEIYENIGEIVYQGYKSEGQIEEKINEKCKEIDGINKEINSLEEQCIELRDKKICVNCKQEINKTVKFCPNCGTEQIEIIDKEKEDDQKKVDKDEKEEIILEVEIAEDDKSNLEKTVEIESGIDNEEDNK